MHPFFKDLLYRIFRDTVYLGMITCPLLLQQASTLRSRYKVGAFLKHCQFFKQTFDESCIMKFQECLLLGDNKSQIQTRNKLVYKHEIAIGRQGLSSFQSSLHLPCWNQYLHSFCLHVYSPRQPWVVIILCTTWVLCNHFTSTTMYLFHVHNHVFSEKTKNIVKWYLPLIYYSSTLSSGPCRSLFGNQIWLDSAKPLSTMSSMSQTICVPVFGVPTWWVSAI